MPAVRKLADDEIRTIERKTLGQRKATAIEYDRHLADFQPGDYGEVNLSEGEKRLTVRNRLKAAGERHVPPLALVFHRTRGDTLRFKVQELESAPAEAPAAEPAPKKRGRPSKSAAPVGQADSAPAARRPRQKRAPVA